MKHSPEQRSAWHAAYNRWHAEQVARARQDYPTGHLEVCEDGSVYLGNLAWLPAGTTTPWQDSEHYRP